VHVPGLRCCADSNRRRSGLLNTYKSLFSLDDSLAEIKTRADLLEYFGDVSSRARDLQPTSSSYFVEETGEVKLLSGKRLIVHVWRVIPYK